MSRPDHNIVLQDLLKADTERPRKLDVNALCCKRAHQSVEIA